MISSVMIQLGGLGLAWTLLYLWVNRLVPVGSVPVVLQTRLRRSRIAAHLVAILCGALLLIDALGG